MITLRLFDASNPFQQIDERKLADGAVVIGRDPACDWPVEDASGDLSRRHCTITYGAGAVHVIDTSSNGIALGHERRRPARGERTPLAAGETVHLGQYLLVVDEPADPTQAEKPATPSQARAPGLTDAALLEHFCVGAGLEPSSFAGEDPAALMERLGAVYRQAVNDLCDLMRERAAAKDHLQVDRTTISARDNNPLKWAPPETIAIELLQEADKGFLKGADAFRASFSDLRLHSDGMAAAGKAAVTFVLWELDPSAVEADIRRQPLAFTSRADAMWRRYRDRHAELCNDADGPRRIERASRAGYQAHLDRDHATRGGQGSA